MPHFFSAKLSFLVSKAMGRRPEPVTWEGVEPRAYLEASIETWEGNWGSRWGRAKTGVVVREFLRESKAC